MLESTNVQRFPYQKSPCLLTLLKANEPTEHRLREECRLVGTSESLWATLKAQSNGTGPLPVKSWVSPGMDFLQALLGQPDPGLNHPLWETFFSLILSQLCPCSNLLAPVLLLYTPLRRVCLCLLCGLQGVFEENSSSPSVCSFPCWTTSVALLWAFSRLSILLLFQGVPKLDTRYSRWSLPNCWAEANSPFPVLGSYALAQDVVGLQHCKGTLLTCAFLLVHRDSAPSQRGCHWPASPRLCLELPQVPGRPSLQLARALLNARQGPVSGSFPRTVTFQHVNSPPPSWCHLRTSWKYSLSRWSGCCCRYSVVPAPEVPYEEHHL